MTGIDAADRALDMIDKQVGAANVACVLIEPIQGEGGFIVPAPGFLASAAPSGARPTGFCFVADEVQTGFCRTGDWFACDDEGVVPDLVTTAKGIAAGMPLAGLTGRRELMAQVHPGGIGGTYSGNPVACAAAAGVHRVHGRAGPCSAARAVGGRLRARLERLMSEHPGVGDVRGRGAMQAVEFVEPGSVRPDPVAATTVASRCHGEGVVVLTCGTWGNVIRLLPPLTIGDDLLDEGLDVLEAAIATVSG